MFSCVCAHFLRILPTTLGFTFCAWAGVVSECICSVVGAKAIVPAVTLWDDVSSTLPLVRSVSRSVRVHMKRNAKRATF